MMEQLHIELLSDATFSARSMAGDVDIDVSHDRLGLPTVPGTTVKRLLAGSWREMARVYPASLQSAGDRVFGVGGELQQTGVFDCGDATVPDDVSAWIESAQHRGEIDPAETLNLMTAVRAQTAVDAATGAPKTGSLRLRRSVLRKTILVSDAEWLHPPTADQRRVLALASLATRHGGLSRSRGAGHLRVTLDGDLTLTQRLAGISL